MGIIGIVVVVVIAKLALLGSCIMAEVVKAVGGDVEIASDWLCVIGADLGRPRLD
ncbi:hypothetical protein K457DRAFT_137994 [Linnemannia elongata AG-77]|uniref:Uncharacterized protein n=1 Tax=Linnemannia elongata AG-77 TaxID=1314771 RepID=A0A197JVI0_9FUNG|nr:hypothetical protein K457DRAFT_137994 [Linnemannia elongata AG-77]